MIWEHATAIGKCPYDRDHGVAFHGNNGVLVVDRGGWKSSQRQRRSSVKRATGWLESRAVVQVEGLTPRPRS
jgi:hypothetical protein